MANGMSGRMTEATPEAVLELAREQELKFVDFRFTDLPGLWHHFSMPIEELSTDTFEEGLGFDGSSIRGFQMIHESDMLLIPDASTAFVGPDLPDSDIGHNLRCP